MNKQIYLTQYGLMAERHWREFRPKMVRDLEAKGMLMDACPNDMQYWVH